jgi:hypothetical protein
MSDIPEWATKKTFQGIKRSPDQFVTRECRSLSTTRSYALDGRDQAGVLYEIIKHSTFKTFFIPTSGLEAQPRIRQALSTLVLDPSSLASKTSTRTPLHAPDFGHVNRMHQSELPHMPDFGHVNRMPVDTATGNIENEGTVQVRIPKEFAATETEGNDRHQNQREASSITMKN